MSNAKKLFAIALLAALAWAVARVAEAQPPIRIGATLSQTGAYATPGQNQLRGYQLCVKHMNDKGGVLGRKLELVVYDDASDPATAVRLYEKLITRDKVDLVLGPFSGPITDAVADVTEKHRMPMMAFAITRSIFKKGRTFVFMVSPPAEVWFEGLIDLAAKKGLRTAAIINDDTIDLKEAADGATELAKRKGLQVVFTEAYPQGTADFSAILRRLGALHLDVLAAGAALEDAVTITRQMKDLGVNPRMYGITGGVAHPKFYETLGRTAEFVYGSSSWLPELVTLRTGGLIPLARLYPGAREFLESYRREFPGATPGGSASGYAMCQILVEAIKRAGSLDGAKIRDAILRLDLNTVFLRRQKSVGFGVSHATFLLRDPF